MAYHVISTELRESNGVKEWKNTISCRDFDDIDWAIDYCICYNPDGQYDWAIVSDRDLDEMERHNLIGVWLPVFPEEISVDEFAHLLDRKEPDYEDLPF